MKIQYINMAEHSKIQQTNYFTNAQWRIITVSELETGCWRAWPPSLAWRPTAMALSPQF